MPLLWVFSLCSSRFTFYPWLEEADLLKMSLAHWLLGFSQWKEPAGDYRVAKRQGRKLLPPSTGLQLASGSIWGYSFILEVPIVTAHSGFWSYSLLSPLVPSDPAMAMTSFYCWLRRGESPSPSLLVPLACSHFHSIFIWVSPVTTLECGCFLLGPCLIQLWSFLIEKCLSVSRTVLNLGQWKRELEPRLA